MAFTEALKPGHSEDVEATLTLPGMRVAASASVEAVPSFEHAYDVYFDFVWRAMRRLGVHEAAIEDAVHDAFLVVHRQLPRFEGRSTLKTWLYGIALRVARDYRRRDRRKGGLQALNDDISAEGRTPEEASADHEAVRLLDRVLSELDEDKREAYVLAEIEGMNVPEIAELVGVNLNTLYSRLRIARTHVETRLQRLLEERP